MQKQTRVPTTPATLFNEADGTGICLEWGHACNRVILSQQGSNNFTVTYGKQARAELNYEQAALELGACIMHALACDGKLDNSEPEDDEPRIHHDIRGWYVVEPHEEEPESGYSLGFDGRAHYATKEEALSHC